MATKHTMDFKELEGRYKKLYAGVISDSLDRFDLRSQDLRYDVRPLYPEALLFGKAFTMLFVETYHVREDPYREVIEAMDSIGPGDVYVGASSSGQIPSTRISQWGELMTTRARIRGAVGAVVDGFTRDVKRIIDSKFPTFVRGVSPVDAAGRCQLLTHNVPIQCGGVKVNPGDYIFGDIDGVLVIPPDLVEDVLKLAEEKKAKEDKTRAGLEAGRSMADVYKEFGVL